MAFGHLLDSYSQQIVAAYPRVTANCFLFIYPVFVATVSLITSVSRAANRTTGGVFVFTPLGPLHCWKKEVFRPEAIWLAC